MSDPTNPVVWFEIPVLDLARAKTFYENLLEVELEVQVTQHHEMALFPREAGDGMAGTLIKGEWYWPSHQGSLIYLATTDVDEMLARAARHGARILQGKTRFGENFVGFFEDCEGNRIGLYSKS